MEDNIYRLRGELVERIKGSSRKHRVTREGVVIFCCPRHDDHNPSAWMGEAAWGCNACGFREPLNTLAEHLNVSPLQRGYTMEQYAEDKGFFIEKLRDFDVDNYVYRESPVMRMPYHTVDGEVHRVKYRAGPRSWWDKQVDRSICPYGLHKLKDAKEVILVEGESDVHALAHIGMFGMGMPGATSWRAEWAKYVEGKEVYVWQEPDDAGAEFVKRISQDIPHARLLKPPEGIKDPAKMYYERKEQFEPELRKMMAEARIVGLPGPPVGMSLMIMDRLEEIRVINEGPIDVVKTPWPSWNRVCRDLGGGEGLARGWHVILAAPSGKGKSIAAANLAVHASEQGEIATYISLEMTGREFMNRALAIASGTPVAQLEPGRAYSRDAYVAAANLMDNRFYETGGGIICTDLPIRELDDVEQAIRYAHDQYGSRFFIIDYLQRAKARQAGYSIFEQVKEISYRVSYLAKSMRITTVGLSQFNRDTTKAKDLTKPDTEQNRQLRPSKEGLMGGSDLENDADQVMLLWSRQRNAFGDIEMTGILDKNRHGEEIDIPLTFSRKTLRVTENQRGY